MNLVRRLRRHLSFANVVACLALFVALGGSAYAATTINGNSIVKHSIGGSKLKNETITSKQIKKGTLNGSTINVSSLGTVPSAQSAVTANSAGSANTANTAGSANTANSANSAASADHATSADSASNADHATSADSATNATHAASADDADTLEGETATELTVSCPTETELFAGMCWDESEQQARSWVAAIDRCSLRGGRLPTVGELIAFVRRPLVQASKENWTSEVVDLDVGNKEFVITSDETSRHKIDAAAGGTLPYRCVFYRAN